MKISDFLSGGEDMGYLKLLKAYYAMKGRVKFCYPTTTWREIASTLVEGEFGSLPVVDSDMNLIGIVTEYDLLEVLLEERDEKDVKAEDIMTKYPVSVEEDAPIPEVIKLLEENHLIRVPVVKDSRLVGILARRDLISCYLKASAE